MMNILYASDENYAGIMGISILSLLENNQEIEEIKVYIITDNISEENCSRVESIFKQYRRPFPIWKKIKNIDEVLKMGVYKDRFAHTQFARLFLEEILDAEDERILYLDCDTIIEGSLKALWEMELNGKTGAVLADAFSPLYRKNIGLEKDALMFNSGVMLIDMNIWRRNKIGEELKDFIVKRCGMVQQGDQGVLNGVLSGQVCVFPARYNLVTNYAAFSYQDMLIYRKPVNIYSKEEIEEANNNPCIVHFTTSFMVARPWEKGKEHPYAKMWEKYKISSPWQEKIYKKKRMKTWKKIYATLAERMPYRLNLFCSGILQAYIRPIYGRWKYKVDEANPVKATIKEKQISG